MVTFLRMELRCIEIVSMQYAGETLAIIAFPTAQIFIVNRNEMAMHVIENRIIRNAVEQQTLTGLVQVIPAHVGNANIGTQSLETNRIRGKPAKTFVSAEFIATLSHQLTPETNSQDRNAILYH